MKKLVTLLVAVGALVLVALTPNVASAGRGWHGGGHWRGAHWGGRGWRGGPRWGYRGYRGWGGPRWGWGGYWGPGVAISIGGYGRRCWSPAWGYYRCGYRWGY